MYEKQYESIEDEEDDGQLSYIKLVNVGTKMITRNCMYQPVCFTSFDCYAYYYYDDDNDDEDEYTNLRLSVSCCFLFIYSLPFSFFAPAPSQSHYTLPPLDH